MTKTAGRPPLSRIKGNLMPAYGILKQLMPKLPASRGLKELAHALGSILGNENLTMPNMLRELGASSGDKAGTLHPDYLAAFRKVFDLDALDVSDEVLLIEDDDRRAATLRALLEHHCFDWLWAQQSDSARLGFADPARSDDATLGPNGGQFVRLQLNTPDVVPVGTEFRFTIELPWAAHITLLSHDPTERRLPLPGFPDRTILHRPIFCLDGFTGAVGRPWPAGGSVLPGQLTMDPPIGRTRTLLIATPKPLTLPWDPMAAVELSLEQLASFMRRLLGTDFVVAGRDYQVGDPPD